MAAVSKLSRVLSAKAGLSPGDFAQVGASEGCWPDGRVSILCGWGGCCGTAGRDQGAELAAPDSVARGQAEQMGRNRARMHPRAHPAPIC